ncbi:hypothetical protein [Peribacillus frigoritolerans]|uniref:hypothetical protein n=1 Tax=Peribacillus frigoritolerans TaxID=450367 RepID=UPI00227E5A66|nr:hypothetical protein [Peribacillus frigoritolerans]MCY9140436.1 hypothetical protein [Peribacillus frigoritolerans]
MSGVKGRHSPLDNSPRLSLNPDLWTLNQKNVMTDSFVLLYEDVGHIRDVQPLQCQLATERKTETSSIFWISEELVSAVPQRFSLSN